MSGRMILLVTAAVITPTVASCGIGHHSVSSTEIPGFSTHTVQELCDFPKPFFAEKFGYRDFRIDLMSPASMDKKLDVGNACTYFDDAADSSTNGEEVGELLLGPFPLEDHSARSEVLDTFIVDGSKVVETSLPGLNTSAPGLRPFIQLDADIDGWYGSFEFWGRDDATVHAGGKVLVDMISKLKGSRREEFSPTK
ncbi:hypothetical protein [Nocardia sp. alder85J]|uniref:hypothetical protein n=1 Tax=Nocardia sp. alder85J TaxID=2862949 RepID=UPI001CD40320|nr:hypothetical protein [Nocardia sp. alder85J]MCX4092074.1 hypothetical protein [Nocardia sp. alder85J]